MKFFTRIPSWLKNKYFICFIAFTAILVFFDKNDLFTQLARHRELKNLQQSRQYFTTQIASERRQLEELKTNPAAIEKYAREKYLMKRDDEDLFVIPENQTNQKN
ncbi:MAG TPA: septum formation initiator family protein [Chitinophagaceae bacterium]|nr:septum formation initiator family protein [Chitinophagaceae bacterium]